MATVVAMATLRKGWDIGYKAKAVEWLSELPFLPVTYRRVCCCQIKVAGPDEHRFHIRLKN